MTGSSKSRHCVKRLFLKAKKAFTYPLKTYLKIHIFQDMNQLPKDFYTF